MTTRRLFALALFVALFAMAVRETLDADLGWHLRTGEWVWQEGVPRADPFSFTVPGKAWVAHEWLADAMMWLVYRAGGLAALSLAFAGAVTAAFGLVYAASPGRPYLAGFLVLLAAITSAFIWSARPQVITLLFAAALALILERWRAGRLDRRALWALPLLTILWANIHSGYFVGIALILGEAAGEAIERRLAAPAEPRPSWPDIGRLGLIALACLLAAAVNPHGPRLWVYPFETLGSPAMQQLILEWQSPDFHQRIYWPFGLMLALGFVGLLQSRRRPPATDILLFMGTAAAGLISVRHIPLFAIVATPIMARAWLSALSGTRAYPLLAGQQATRPATRGQAAVNWAILAVLVAAAAVWSAGRVGNNGAAIAAGYPAAAVDYLEQAGLAQRRGFHHYNWGGYLIWRQVPVFIDGRADLYGDSFLFEYVATSAAEPGWPASLDRYAIDYVLWPPDNLLARLLERDPGWQRIYGDDVATIFVRAGAGA